MSRFLQPQTLFIIAMLGFVLMALLSVAGLVVIAIVHDGDTVAPVVQTLTAIAVGLVTACSAILPHALSNLSGIQAAQAASSTSTPAESPAAPAAAPAAQPGGSAADPLVNPYTPAA